MIPEEPKKRRRGVYLLPNLFTTFGLFSGFYAIISAINGQFVHAAVAVFAAMVLDGIDGRVARMTNTQTDFGAQYDSLSDLVSFGLAPALIMYEWSLKSLADMGSEMGKLGWLAAFVYTAMAALRLARFNASIGKVEKKYFVGLASPAAAMLVVSFVWVCEEFLTVKVNGTEMWLWSLIITVGAAALMISPIFYHSFKEINQEGRIPFKGTLIIVLLLVLVIIDPPKVTFAVFLLYALSGPIFALSRRISRRHGRATKPLPEVKNQKP